MTTKQRKPVLFSWRQAVLESELQATTKLVLLTLACHMNDAGESCFPSIQKLCKETSLSNRAVITHLQVAADLGWIEISKHGFAGQQWARNEYRPSWPQGSELPSLPQGGEPASLPPKAVNVVPKGSEPDDGKAVKEVHTSTPVSTPRSTSVTNSASADAASGSAHAFSLTPTSHQPNENEAPSEPQSDPDDGFQPIRTKRGRLLKGWSLIAFMRFWKTFAWMHGRAEAADAWLDIPDLTPQLAEHIIACAAVERDNRSQAIASGRTPKWAQGWLTARRFDDESLQPKAPRGTAPKQPVNEANERARQVALFNAQMEKLGRPDLKQASGSNAR